MKMVDKYLLGTLLKSAIGATLLCTMMLVSVQLFSNLDSFLKNQTPLRELTRLALYYVPSSFCFVLAPALLFSAAFTFSQLSANNELICLYNASFSQLRLVTPVLLAGILFCALQFFVQEVLDIPSQHKLMQLQTELIGVKSTSSRRDITLSDFEKGYVFYASGYNDESKTAQRVTVVLVDENQHLEGRVDARRAIWKDEGSWVMEDVDLTTIDWETMEMEKVHHPSYTLGRLSLEPQLLKDNSTDIKSMSIKSALTFLGRMERLDHALWQGYAVDFWQRMLGTLAPFVMLCIACTMNYRFKKNVLLFSIILSLCLAVIYYVVQMMTLILARQGLLDPVGGMLIPMFMVFFVALLERLLL